MRLLVGLVLRLAAELDEQEAVAVRQHREVLVVEADHLHVLEQHGVHALEAERLCIEHLADVVGRLVLVVVAEHEQGAVGRGMDEVDARFEHQRAGALGSGQRSGDVESPLRQEIVEVVAGDAAREVGVARADLVGVVVAQVAQARIDLAAPAAVGGDPLQLLVARFPDLQPGAVVEEEVELVDVVGHPRPGPVELGPDRADTA